jgi:hypothetical protein
MNNLKSYVPKQPLLCTVIWHSDTDNGRIILDNFLTNNSFYSHNVRRNTLDHYNLRHMWVQFGMTRVEFFAHFSKDELSVALFNEFRRGMAYYITTDIEMFRLLSEQGQPDRKLDMVILTDTKHVGEGAFNSEELWTQKKNITQFSFVGENTNTHKKKWWNLFSFVGENTNTHRKKWWNLF